MTSNLTPTDLLECSLDVFKKYVDEDTRAGLSRRGQRPHEDIPALRDPLVVDRWIIMLTKMKRDSEFQLANYDPEVDIRGQPRTPEEAKRWRSSVMRFRNGVEDRLAEAKLVAKGTDAQRLREAILKHKTSILADAGDDADLELWSHLE